jgi:hypothetical protein
MSNKCLKSGRGSSWTRGCEKSILLLPPSIHRVPYSIEKGKGGNSCEFRKYTVVILVQRNIHVYIYFEPESQRFIYGIPYPFL